jgi:hypothetical protein
VKPSDSDSAERDAILARLAESRTEISRLLERPPETGGGDGDGAPRPAGSAGGFPRSRTMQALMSGRGIGAMGAMAGGLLLARPRLAWRVLRMLPTSAVTRMIVARVVGAMRGKE